MAGSEVKDWSAQFTRAVAKIDSVFDKKAAPFYGFNYAVYTADPKTLTVGSQVFPKSSGKPLLTPKTLEDKHVAGPVLQPDTYYYVTLRIRNSGNKTWSLNPLDEDYIVLGEAPFYAANSSFKEFTNSVSATTCKNAILNKEQWVSICKHNGAGSFWDGSAEKIKAYSPTTFGAIDINQYATAVDGSPLTQVGTKLKTISTECKKLAGTAAFKKQMRSGDPALAAAMSLNRCDHILGFMKEYLVMNPDYVSTHSLEYAYWLLPASVGKCGNKIIKKVQDFAGVLDLSAAANIWMHYTKLLKAGTKYSLAPPYGKSAPWKNPCGHFGWGAPLIQTKTYPSGMYQWKKNQPPHVELGGCIDSPKPETIANLALPNTPTSLVSTLLKHFPNGKFYERSLGKKYLGAPEDTFEEVYRLEVVYEASLDAAHSSGLDACASTQDCKQLNGVQLQCIGNNEKNSAWVQGFTKGKRKCAHPDSANEAAVELFMDYYFLGKKLGVKYRDHGHKTKHMGYDRKKLFYVEFAKIGTVQGKELAMAKLPALSKAASVGLFQSKFRHDVSKLHCRDKNIKKQSKSLLWDSTRVLGMQDAKAGDIAGMDWVYAGFYFKTPSADKLGDYTEAPAGFEGKIPPKHSFALDMVRPNQQPAVGFGVDGFLAYKVGNEKKTNIKDMFYNFEQLFFHIGKYIPLQPIAAGNPKKDSNNVDNDPVDGALITKLDVVGNDPLLFEMQSQLAWIAKQEWPPYGETFFMTDHYYGPTEEGFILGGSLDTMSDKFRKYTNSVWQVAKLGSGLNASLRMSFDVDYQLRKGILPGGEDGTAAHKTRPKTASQRAQLRKDLLDWVKLAESKGKKTHQRYPQLTDTGVKDVLSSDFIEPASNEDIEEIFKIEAITRKTLPQGDLDPVTKIPLHCQHPYNVGTYSSNKRCKTYGMVRKGGKAVLTNDQKTKCKAGTCPPGYVCHSDGECKWEPSTEIAKTIEESDHYVKIAGIIPGYDFDNYEIDLPGYKTYDYQATAGKEKTLQDYVDQKFNEYIQEESVPPASFWAKCKDLGPFDRIKLMTEGGPVKCAGEVGTHPCRQYPAADDKSCSAIWGKWYAEQLAQNEPWATREMLPGKGKLTLQLGDEIDRTLWGQGSDYQNWTPATKWINPPIAKQPLPAGEANFAGALQAGPESFDWGSPNPAEISFKFRPTLELSDPPIINTLNSMIKSMESGKNKDGWHYDFNFTYKPYQKNSPISNLYVQEIDVTSHGPFGGDADPCLKAGLEGKITELQLPFVYEGQQKPLLTGLEKNHIVSGDCKPTKYDLSVVSLAADGGASQVKNTPEFHNNTSIFNEITFDITNGKLDSPKRNYLFSSATEEERKTIFWHAVSADHSGEKDPSVISLIAEHKGSLNFGNRPYFYSSRRVLTDKSTSVDIKHGVIQTSLIQNIGKEKPIITAVGAKALLNDTTVVPDSIKKPGEWIFENKKLKKEWFRDYAEILAGQTANYEIIAYKLVKSGHGTRTKHCSGSVGVYGQVGQPIYIYPDLYDSERKKQIVRYIDTQVKVGSLYTYDLYAVVLVYGTKYKYANPSIGRQYKTFDKDSAGTDESLEDNYQKYVGSLDKTPSHISPIFSKQKTQIGSHPTKVTAVEQGGGTQKSTKQTAATEVKDFTTDNDGLEHKLKYVHSYSISSYVNSRPQLAIFEVPLLRKKFNT